jgi:SAM-dependent methyltransferase
MLSEIRWRFGGNSPALRTEVGERIGELIRVNASWGCALSGPNLDVPAGRCRARVKLAAAARGKVRLELTGDGGQRVLAAQSIDLAQAGTEFEVAADLTEAVEGLEVRLFCRSWNASLEISALEIDLDRDLPDAPLSPDRAVGFETSKTYADKISSGFFQRFMSGPVVMEIGYKGYDGGTTAVVPQAIGVDVGYPGYDGETFPFADESFDAIYSSHCFEHIGPWKAVLRDWYRMLKPGGFLIIVVPHQFLFERKRHLPSRFNPDHKRFYTPRSLLGELEAAFEENSYRIRHLVENDNNFDYAPAPWEGSSGCYEIELVVEKINRPYWRPDDGSVRPYAASEFHTHLERNGAWSLELPLVEPGRCLVWGPYIGLDAAQYTAEFNFDPIDLGPDETPPSLVFDVAIFADRIAMQEVSGDLARQVLREGRVVVPFSTPADGSIMEFRTYVGRTPSDLRLRFRGVVIDYQRPGTA